MPVVSISPGLAEVVAGSQAPACGLSVDTARWLLRSGRWQRVHRGIYVTHNGPLTTAQRECAALLYAGEGAALSHHTAAARDGFRGYPSPEVHVSVPSERRVRGQPRLVVHRSGSLTGIDVHPDRAPRRTRLPRSIVDMATDARRREDIRAILAGAGDGGSAAPGGTAAATARQLPLRNGRYYLDLWWEGARLAVEVDGSQHMVGPQWWSDMDR